MTIRNSSSKKEERHSKRSPADLAKKNKSAILLIDSWLDDDEKEQRETFEYLKKVLDEDRLSDRKLFK